MEKGLEITSFEIHEIINFRDLFDERKPKFLIRLL